MTGPDPDEAIRAAARELLGQLVNGNGHARNGRRRRRSPPVGGPRRRDRPPGSPPVAAVLRPSTWSGPAAPGR